jgi:hypothetical protein
MYRKEYAAVDLGIVSKRPIGHCTLPRPAARSLLRLPQKLDTHWIQPRDSGLIPEAAELGTITRHKQLDRRTVMSSTLEGSSESRRLASGNSDGPGE